MIETLKRAAYRVSRNFVALVLIQMNLNFIAGPIYYIVGIVKYGWYSLAPWQIKMMLTVPIQEIPNFSLLAIFLLAIWGILVAPFMLLRTVRNFSANRTGKYSTN